MAKQLKEQGADDLSKRPVSAHASLHKKFDIDSDENDDDTGDKGSELPKNPMNRRISLATLRNMENRIVNRKQQIITERNTPTTKGQEYWNRRVRNLILKWNVEDKGESYLERWDLLAKTSSTGPPPLLTRDPNMGEAEIKAKSFVRKYANKYRTLLRIASAPPTDTRQRRSEKITRQELASIHADIAKRRKNTRTILRKSKRLKIYVEQLASVAQDD
ncbi:hypothetical protein FSP39_021904 [Pinctada imbricata]|uniref:Uncharacterized protein n=1 Tax=Pinctada imbricata TaxID=66713 RepID=A0AA89BZX9_PINIB|nr:hypothetical protein FSP39_021904 [Pinctada imbricata]